MRGVRVLLAPDGFGGTLTATQAARTERDGWLAAAPADEVDACPLADGGPGFLEALTAGLGGELVPGVVTAPLGTPTPAAILVVDGADGRRTAYVESAHAAGLHLVPADRRDPTRATTYGVGELVAQAVASGASRVVVGLGGSGTVDAGAGLIAALAGAGPGAPLAGGGGALAAVDGSEVRAAVAAARRRVAGVDLVAAVDVDVPLLGLQGASAGFAAQKGATPQQAQDLERALARFVRLAAPAGGTPRRSLLATAASCELDATRPETWPGAGAAGGLGFGLALLGARLLPGAAIVADAAGLEARIAGSDVVVTGEGTFDWQSLHGKVVTEVAARALGLGVPAVVLAGQVRVSRREWAAAGFAAVYAVANTPDEVDRALADPAGTLRARATRVARTWSR